MNILDTTLPRILGACFYYRPTTDIVKQILPAFENLANIFPWSDPDKIKQLSRNLHQTTAEALEYDFSVMFEGQGHMPAPPWGSIYLQEDNLLMGESTLAYRHFLSQHGIALNSEQNEPDDQFGLMLLALSWLLEQGNGEAAKELLKTHLLPWASRYLELLGACKTEQPFYPQLAKIAQTYLDTLQTELEIDISPVQWYF